MQLCKNFGDWIKLKLITSKAFVTPEEYGAIGDGVTDDTKAIQKAIIDNNIKFKTDKNYLIKGVIYVPSFRIIDGNMCNIISNSSECIFKINSADATGGKQLITIKNFKCNLSNSGSFIDAYNSYFIIVDNIRTSSITQNCHVLKFINCFNVQINKCYAYGNSERLSGSEGIILDTVSTTADAVSSFTNMTNISIRDSLIQSFENGISINTSGGGAYDTTLISNLGISNCKTGINLLSKDINGVSINTYRCESSDYAIRNYGAIVNITNLHIQKDLYAIDNNSGVISFFGSFEAFSSTGGKYIIDNNNGVLDFSGTSSINIWEKMYSFFHNDNNGDIIQKNNKNKVISVTSDAIVMHPFISYTYDISRFVSSVVGYKGCKHEFNLINTSIKNGVNVAYSNNGSTTYIYIKMNDDNLCCILDGTSGIIYLNIPNITMEVSQSTTSTNKYGNNSSIQSINLTSNINNLIINKGALVVIYSTSSNVTISNTYGWIVNLEKDSVIDINKKPVLMYGLGNNKSILIGQ